MKACAITDKQPSICEVFLISKTNWGFFSIFTQKRRGRLDRERTSMFKINHSGNTAALKWCFNYTALMERSTFLVFLFMLKNGIREQREQGAHTHQSVSFPSLNNALNLQVLLSVKSVCRLRSPGSYGGFYRCPINILKLLKSTY